MKPAPFGYAAPRTVDDALALLDDDEALVLAGGQSLVPMMNFRLARPATLVDINGIDELTYLRESDGTLHCGALTRHATLERSELVAAHWPLLRQAVVHVAHPPIRSRGTLGGTCAHADATAELPVALTALGAVLHTRSRAGARAIPAAGFFLGHFTTALEPGELLVEVEVPPLPAGARTGFAEHALTHGDWAIAGAAVVVAPGHAAIVLLGAGAAPVRAGEAEAALTAGEGADRAADLSAALVDDPWRAAVTATLVRRALAEAGA